MSDPYPKSKQLARGERRYRRKVASPKQWQAIIAAKGATCRLEPCMTSLALHPKAMQYHHLIARSRGGDDVADNIVPLCGPHHELVTWHDRETLAELAACLTDAEYAYVIGKLGEGAFERLFGVGS